MNPLALIIENDSGTRKLLTVLLTRAGYEVDAVANGSVAMLLLAQVQYDVIFVEHLLPSNLGGDVLDWLATDRRHDLERVVILSSATPAQLQNVRDRWPGARVFRKPFELNHVVAAVEELSALPRCRDGNALADQFIRRSVKAGAKAGIVVKTNGAVAEYVLDFGYEREQAAAYFPLEVASPVPLCESIRHGRPVWLASPHMVALEFPILERVLETSGSRALATVPLMRRGQVVGAAGWSFCSPRIFTEIDQQVFASIGESLVEWLPGTAERA